MNYLQKPKSTIIKVIGESGSAFWDYEKNTLLIVSKKEKFKEKSTMQRNEMFINSISDFIKSISFSKDPKSDLNDGIEALKIVDSIKKSISTRLVEKI